MPRPRSHKWCRIMLVYVLGVTVGSSGGPMARSRVNSFQVRSALGTNDLAGCCAVYGQGCGQEVTFSSILGLARTWFIKGFRNVPRYRTLSCRLHACWPWPGTSEGGLLCGVFCLTSYSFSVHCNISLVLCSRFTLCDSPAAMCHGWRQAGRNSSFTCLIY